MRSTLMSGLLHALPETVDEVTLPGVTAVEASSNPTAGSTSTVRPPASHVSCRTTSTSVSLAATRESCTSPRYERALSAVNEDARQLTVRCDRGGADRTFRVIVATLNARTGFPVSVLPPQ